MKRVRSFLLLLRRAAGARVGGSGRERPCQLPRRMPRSRERCGTLPRPDRLRRARQPGRDTGADRVRASAVPRRLQPAGDQREPEDDRDRRRLRQPDYPERPHRLQRRLRDPGSADVHVAGRRARVLRQGEPDGKHHVAPAQGRGLGVEIALDVEVAHAICQNCKIILVEANSNSFTNLAAAVDEAAVLGANVISNSYGGSEFSQETSSAYDGHFNHPGIALTVSSGDAGYGVEYPAASRYVTAVGGTTLRVNGSNQRTSERRGAAPARAAAPTSPSRPGRPTRAAAAGRSPTSRPTPTRTRALRSTTRPATRGRAAGSRSGAPVSAAPLIGAVYALGNPSGSTAGSYPYSHTSSLFDVTSGSNGSCGGSYLCTAVAGFDGPTGLGTPNGTGGF